MSANPWHNRITGYGEVSPDALVAHPSNWRLHPQRQARALAAVLGDVGIVQNIIVNTHANANRIVDGHLRVELARKQNQPSVPVTYVDLSAEEEALVLATLDPIGAMAGQDDEILASLLSQIDTEDTVILELLSSLSGEPLVKPGLTDPDAVPDPPTDPITRRGDLWILGDHRLLCGDSTDPADVARLMAGERAVCLWTDPPYGVNYVGKTKDALTIQNDAPEGLADLLYGAFTSAQTACIDGASFYIAHPAGSLSLTFADAVRRVGWRLHETLVWVKDSLVLGHSDYHYRHEPILYGYMGGTGRRGRGGDGWYGDNAQTSVFEVDRPKSSPDHPTAKPVDLVTPQIRNSSQPNDWILDLFGGSGSTLIACEQIGRRCAMMELDPIYCDVIIRRFEEFTGRTAVRQTIEAAAD